jgi:hypothetical protein
MDKAMRCIFPGKFPPRNTASYMKKHKKDKFILGIPAVSPAARAQSPDVLA